MTSRIGALVLTVACAALLSGCFVIKSQTVAQVDLIGEVQIATTACFSDGGPNCPDDGNSGSTGGSGLSRALIAYRLADGVVSPDSFSSASGDPMTMHRDDQYTDELEAKAVTPPGQHWVGYSSDGVAPTTGTDVTFEPRFGLPQGADGAPYKGPFRYQVVTGEYAVFQPTSCMPDPQDSNVGPGGGGICIDSPPRDEYKANLVLETRDLGLKGSDVKLRQGDTVEAPFTAEYAGSADAQAAFDLSVATPAPDVVVSVPSGHLTPAADSSNPVTVKIGALPTAKPGTYNLALVAHGPNGVERKRTVKLTVEPGRPYNLALPQVTGTAVVGQVLTCERGDWSGSPAGFAYQWTRDAAPIAGAIGQGYKLTEADGARLIACTVKATNSLGDGLADSGHVRAAQHGGADVSLKGKAKLIPDGKGAYKVDTGITIGCPPRLPVPCAGGTHIDATTPSGAAARNAATRQVAKGGFAVRPGKKLKLVLHLSRGGVAMLKRQRELSLVTEVTTRNHALERVTSRKTFTVRAR
jgi:hypothetical protein